MKLRATGEPVREPDIHGDERWRMAARIETYVVASMWLAMMAMFAVVAFTIA